MVFAWIRAIQEAKKVHTTIRKQNLKIANQRKDFNWLLRELELKIENGEEVRPAARSSKKQPTKTDFMNMTEEEAREWLEENYEVMEAMGDGS